MKKIFLAIFAFLTFAHAALAQTAPADNAEGIEGDPVVTNSFWSNWYVQAGLDMTLLNPYGCSFSDVFPKGKTFGLDVATGKWFTPEVGLRLRLNWENGFPLFKNGHLEWLAPIGDSGKNMDKGGVMAIYGDVQLNLLNTICGYDEERKWSLLVFPRAGFLSNLAIKSSSPMVGVGVGTTYRLNERLSLYTDMAYQVMTSEFYGGLSTTGMTVSAGSNGFFDFHIGVQWDLGKIKGKFRRLSSY